MRRRHNAAKTASASSRTNGAPAKLQAWAWRVSAVRLRHTVLNAGHEPMRPSACVQHALRQYIVSHRVNAAGGVRAALPPCAPRAAAATATAVRSGGTTAAQHALPLQAQVPSHVAVTVWLMQ